MELFGVIINGNLILFLLLPPKLFQKCFRTSVITVSVFDIKPVLIKQPVHAL